MSTGRERRKSARLPIPLEVELRVGDTAFNTGQTRDLSPRGIYLLTDQQPPLGKECRLLFRVGGPRGQLRFEVNGRIGAWMPAAPASSSPTCRWTATMCSATSCSAAWKISVRRSSG